MKAAIVPDYGPPEILSFVERKQPSIGPNEVLVRVACTSVTAAESRIRSANFPRGFAPFARMALGIRRPRTDILGNNFSGVVEAVGPDVLDVVPGDEICGAAKRTWAEYIAVDVRKGVVKKPAAITHEQAAATIFGGATAYHFLCNLITIEPGQRVLVIGAAGVVGSSAVQIARHYGATVTGVARASARTFVESLGASRCIAYENEGLDSLNETFDVVFDVSGRLSVKRGRELAGDDGKVLLVVADLWQMFARKQIVSGVANVRSEDLAILLGLVETGAYQPAIDSIFSLDDIVEANRRFETGGRQGVVLIRPEG